MPKKSNKPLTLNGLTKYYGRHRGIDGISLELNRGEVFGFLGPNGAGKSTTIRTILNFIHPTSGSAKVFGLDSQTESVAIKHRVGYLAGSIAVPESMTVRGFFTYMNSLGRDVKPANIKQLAERLNLDMDKKIGSLSKGNHQKVGIINAFMHQPQLLILDEPTSGLDPLMKEEFYDMVREVKRDDRTVFISSHDLAEVEKICDRVGFIKDGQLLSVQSVADIKQQNHQQFTVEFARRQSKATLLAIKDVDKVHIAGRRATVDFTGDLAKLLRAVAALDPVSFTQVEPDLEDVFLSQYKDKP